jgi:hypothetical protein
MNELKAGQPLPHQTQPTQLDFAAGSMHAGGSRPVFTCLRLHQTVLTIYSARNNLGNSQRKSAQASTYRSQCITHSYNECVGSFELSAVLMLLSDE